MAMRRFGILGRLILALSCLVLVFGCDDSTTPVPKWGISGNVRSLDGTAVSGATVYFGNRPDFFSSPWIMIVDSTLTNFGGGYFFENPRMNGFGVYAGVWNHERSDFKAVSPFAPANDLVLKEALTPPSLLIDLTVQDIQRDGVVAGSIFYFDGENKVPCDSTEVVVERYLGAQLLVVGTTETNADGGYAVPSIPTGNCIVHATKELDADGPFPGYIAGETAPFFCDGRTLVRVPDLVLTDVMAEKPAIYIYPTEPGRYAVHLDLADRVRMTTSIPEYGDGWDVFIDQQGRIDGRWDYLFYEVAMRGAPLLRDGWCLDGRNLQVGLERIVRQLGLNDQESRDFLDYWLRRVPRYRWVVVQPVMGRNLDYLARVRVDPAPTRVLRFWLLFSGSDHYVEMPTPVAEPFVRRGSVLVEWGGAVVPPER